MSARLERAKTLNVLSSDPYGQMARRKRFDEELESIRARSRSIWSRPDTSLTTHRHFYVDPQQNERTSSRPTSAGRRHNPHPKLVFMRTGMREIPNAYGAPPSRGASREVISRPPTTTNDSTYLEQLQDLTDTERLGVNAFLKVANEDSKIYVTQAVRNYRTMMSNEYECPPIGASTINREDGSRTEFYPSMEKFRQTTRNDKEITAINEAINNPDAEIKVVDESQPQSVLQRNGRYRNRPQVHFQRRSHSHHTCPWPLAKHPYRGDYSIHSDWHPRLPHHRLTCLC